MSSARLAVVHTMRELAFKAARRSFTRYRLVGHQPRTVALGTPTASGRYHAVGLEHKAEA